MRGTGAVTLVKIADKLEVLRVECAKSDRKGRYLVERLLAQRGSATLSCCRSCSRILMNRRA